MCFQWEWKCTAVDSCESDVTKAIQGKTKCPRARVQRRMRVGAGKTVRRVTRGGRWDRVGESAPGAPAEGHRVTQAWRTVSRVVQTRRGRSSECLLSLPGPCDAVSRTTPPVRVLPACASLTCTFPFSTPRQVLRRCNAPLSGQAEAPADQDLHRED